MYDINLYQQHLARVSSTKWKQFVLTRKGLPNNCVILATEQSIKPHLFFWAFAYILNQLLDLLEHLTMTASATMIYIAIDYENELNMKVAASNVNIKIHQLFSKQRILGVRETIAQQKTSGGLTQTGS